MLSPDFMPHGYCYLWNPWIVWLHAVSDGLITLSYYCIPIILIYFVRKHRDISFNRMFWMFGTFILACGTTHLMEIWNIWHASYLVAGVVKGITAAASVITAAILIPLVPKVISLPERMHLDEVNRRLEAEIARRKHFDVPVDVPLKRRMAAGFAIAVLVTLLIGFSAWRGSQFAADGDYWLAHTYDVMDAIEITSKHVIEAETSARAFALTGQEPLLARYRLAREAISEDANTLRRLTADNPGQQRRLGVLDTQVRTALAFAEEIIAKRQTNVIPGGPEALEIERLTDAVRATTEDIHAEEMRLLVLRTQRAQSGRRLTREIAVSGTLVGTGLWVLARLAVSREINVSAEAQLSSLNADVGTGEPWEMEFPLRGADGRFRMFLTRVMPVKDATGRVHRWFGTNTDISERNRAQKRLAKLAQELAAQATELASSRQALEAQTLMLRSVLDSMAEGLVATDEHGKFVIWNPAAEKILGLGAANLPSQEWTEHYGLFLPDTVTPFPPDQIPLVRAIRGETSSTEMFVRNAELGEGVWVETSASPLMNKDGTVRGGVVAFRDVTKSKAAEREIRKLNEDLELRVAERTEQLEIANKELEAFTYSVSHDLRAPLRHISGFSNLLVEEFSAQLPQEAQHYLHRIEEGASRMGQLVDEMLNLARVGRYALSRKPTSLNSIVAEVIAMLKPDSEGRDVEWRIAELPSVECDPVLVRQIFQNLLANALKFTRPRPHTVIEIGQREENGQPVIFVRDNGVGFSMKYVDKLFGVFQRLHRAEDFEGTGVGLATVQRIVQKHGGRIWAESAPDRGATFNFTLRTGVPGQIAFSSPDKATGVHA